MAEYTIDKIQYGDDIYHLQDANVGIDSEYISADYEVVLTVGSLGDADNTEY